MILAVFSVNIDMLMEILHELTELHSGTGRASEHRICAYLGRYIANLPSGRTSK